MADLFDTLTARGFVQDSTPGLADRLLAGPVTAYAGFDPTADSLHVGSLVPVMGLAWLQRFGHHPIALVGGGTGMVGDPSGRQEERRLLGLDQIDRNAASIGRQLARFLSFEGSNAARMRNNADWLRGLRLMEFLRDTGKHFTVSYMLQKESVRSRLGREGGITYTEFSYMLIQAYDFLHLYQAEGCELQLGGSDQWGNITAGIELIGRREGVQVHGMVFPLITSASGAKFGKSEGGNVWLDAERTSPYHFYQFWLNTDDRDVEAYLRLFTFLPLDQVAAVMDEQASDPAKRAGQRRLAREVTTLVHGDGAAQQSIQTSEALFGGRTSVGALEALPEMPEKRVSRAQWPDGIPVVDLLVASGLASSKADARRGIQGRGFYLNGEPIDNVELRIGDEALQGSEERRFVILRKGKKNYVRVVVEG